MEHSPVNVLITTFAGLGLPRTLSLPFDRSTPIHKVVDAIYSRLPQIRNPLSLTTTSNRYLSPHSHDCLSSVLSAEHDTILSLRLRALTLGGKGGFGSQLRAAGGRMSSRKKRNQQNQPQNGSNRNLDGRRLRTVDAAKKLADYLSQKPDMEKREREERRKKWESVVEMAGKREEDILSGKTAPRLDAEYVEGKELAEDKTREAIIQAMKNGGLAEGRTGSESSLDAMRAESNDEAEDGSSSSSEDQPMHSEAGGSRTFFGWDEEEDDDSDDDSASESGGEEDKHTASSLASSYTGKGKGKVVD